MKPNIIHCIVVCLTALALPFIVACSSREESLSGDVETVLLLNVETIRQTRSGLTDLSGNEKMHSVRVVVLHNDGTVEHNRHYLLDGAQEQKYIFLKVTPNEKKKIFLFANEESVSAVEGMNDGENMSLTQFFKNYEGVGTKGFADAVDCLYFAPDYSHGNPIPMSAMYEIDVHGEGKVERTFYVVRVATKFTVNFMNWRGEEVIVDDFTFASYANKNFLMAHVNNSEQNKQLFNGKTWIDWLKDVSDASSENDSYDITEAVGWLKDYELPTQADKAVVYTHGKVKVGAPTVDIDSPDNSKPGVANNVPVFYLPESMSLKPDAADGEQEYTMTININGRTEPFVFKLPNLKALFRNTNVVVDITLYNSNEIAVDVIPYSEIILEPVFGL